MNASPKPQIENPKTAVAAVKLLLGSPNAPRLAMQGTSMLPLLRKPMVLELEQACDLKIGDVVVFEAAGKLVVHRVTSLARGLIQTCGDARPWSPEQPPFGSLVGRVKAVREHDGAGARQVDTAGHRLRGAFYARTRAVRALPHAATALARRLQGALPWRRERAYASLVLAMSAAMRSDSQAFASALARSSGTSLAAVALRHGCSAALLEALRIFDPPGPQAALLRQALQARGREAVLLSLVAKSSVASLASVLARSQIPFALLKGAARLYRGEPDATLHASGDFDVLVPAAYLQEAVEALRLQGYDERLYAERRERFLAHHHHAAPLFPPGLGFAVELHTALAPPGLLSIALDWEALRDLMEPIAGQAGEVLCLNRVGAALHLAVHSLGLKKLRDSVLLARLLAQLDDQERAKLQSIAGRERTDPVRLRASLVLGARLAGVGWPSDPDVERYLDWAARRADVPLFFSERSQLAEGWYAAGRGFSKLAVRLVDPRSGLAEETQARTWWRACGRIVASGCAFAYARAMRGRP